MPDANADLVWDMATNSVIAQTSAALSLTPLDRDTPILFVKEQDDFMARIRVVKSGSVLDLATEDNALKLVLKELEPGGTKWRSATPPPSSALAMPPATSCMPSSTEMR
ncbi:MAG: hypothetical protein WDN28_15400 [Chthoniobacter sp.]